MSSRSRIPGMAGLRSFAIPRCSIHMRPTVRGSEGQFVCPDCMDEWLQKIGSKTAGGVELPDHVKDERLPSFRQLLPNRRARRQVMRG